MSFLEKISSTTATLYQSDLIKVPLNHVSISFDFYTYRSAQGINAMPLNAKQAASPNMPVASPINAMGPRISNQLSLFENNNSELIHTSCIKLPAAVGTPDMVVVVDDTYIRVGSFFVVSEGGSF